MALISLESINGITAGGLAIVTEICLLCCGLILAGSPKLKLKSLLLWTVGSFLPRVCR
jgi:hypothetical protein